jgi:hypothetical protein
VFVSEAVSLLVAAPYGVGTSDYMIYAPQLNQAFILHIRPMSRQEIQLGSQRIQIVIMDIWYELV